MKIGALWLKEKDGKKFFTGEINLVTAKINVAIFKNDEKKAGTAQPDYHIILSEPRKDKPQTTEASEEITPDDIPF